MKKTTIKEFTQPQIERVVNTILSLNWQNKKLYGDMLAQTYYHIVHSTRLLAAAAARFPAEQEIFHLHCLKHASEEKSHEKLSRSDLKSIGFSLSDFSELPGTKALYRTNYYLIEHVSPLALFGYAYFLEWIAIAAGKKVLEQVRPHFGQKSAKHMNVHTKEDPKHIEAYEHMLEALQGADRAIVEEAITTTSGEYERIFFEIKQRHALSTADKNKAA